LNYTKKTVYTLWLEKDPCYIFKQLQQILVNINNFWYSYKESAAFRLVTDEFW